MSGMARHWCFGWVVCCAIAGTSPACAQDWNAASMLYGHGVHAFFAGQYAEAEQSLARAIHSHPDDPRPYYFRAMSLLRLGREAEAREDMQLGAAIEARRPHRYAIGTALERVQGSDRLMLEQYRRRARLDEATHRDERNRTRYEQVIGREGDVLRQPEDLPLEQLAPPADTHEIPASQAAPLPEATPLGNAAEQQDAADSASQATSSNDPFADDPVQPENVSEEPAPQDAQPATASDELEDDPFADSSADEESAEESGQEEDASADETPSDTEEEDPFGGF